MIVLPFFVRGLAHSSYLVGGKESCAIVDPSRDVDRYIEAAKDMGMKITHILETHLHADFVSGHLDLSRITGAPIYAPKAGHCAFEHQAVVEGDEIEMDDLVFKVVETPGHTPEHISYVTVDGERGSEPVAVFCGDTLFVGDVGRPDLFPGRAQELAQKLYESLRNKLLKLPDFCEVYPAHGAGSLCGRAMGAKRTSTIGYERKYNYALQFDDRQEFVKALTDDMPAAPDHFGVCTRINVEGPTLTSELPAPEPMPPLEFQERARREDTVVLDVRSYGTFGGQHVPGSQHIYFRGNFPTFAGWILPYDKDILLVTDDMAPVDEVCTWLRRVGLDRVLGTLAGGMQQWANAGLPIGHVTQVAAEALQRRLDGGGAVQLVDVRSPTEFEGGHIEGAMNIPAPDVRTRYKELRKDLPTLVTCNTGNRSSLATSLLIARGFENVMNVAGGMTGYYAAGNPGSCALCVAPHVPRFPR